MTKTFIIGNRQQIENILGEVQEYEPGNISYHMYHHFGAHENIYFVIYIENNIAHYYSEVDIDNEEIQYIKEMILDEYPNSTIYDMTIVQDDITARMNAMQLGGKKKRKTTKKNKMKSSKKNKRKTGKKNKKTNKRKTYKKRK